MIAPKNFNWVAARAKCSIEQAFITLREVVDSDIKERIAQFGNTKDDELKISLSTDTKFIVARSWDAVGIRDAIGIVFERTSTGVTVKEARSQQELFRAVPELTADGDCKFAVEGKNHGEPLEFWQVSRLALEKLFFER